MAIEVNDGHGGRGSLELGFARDSDRAVEEQDVRRLLTAGDRCKFSLKTPSSDDFAAERAQIFESVVVNAADTILITKAFPIDEPGPEIVYVNAAFERMSGYDASEIVGRSPRFLQGEATSIDTRSRIRRALANWEPIEVELVNYRRDGSMFWVEISIVPVLDASGWYSHWISIQRDTTAKRHARGLAALSTEIAERVRAQERLAHIAFHDGLTGMRNRGFFVERLTESLGRVDSRLGRAFAVLFFDLDRFKIVNDSLGHRAGDLLLQEMAKRIPLAQTICSSVCMG